MIIPNAAIGDGGWIASPTAKLWNRTGAATVRGGLYLLDLVATQAESQVTTYTYMNLLSNVTGVLTASLQRQYVVANEIIADNAQGQFFAPLGDAVVCMMTVDGSGTALVVGDPLKGATASANAVKATAASDCTIGFALQAATTAGALIAVLFYGRAARQG